MVSITDLTDGPKMFRETFGSKWGPRLWRGFFTIVVLAISAVAVSQILGGWHSVYSEVAGWFSPPSTSAPTSPRVSSQPSGCIVSGGNKYGKIEQTCK
jgi:hypothetical protein